MTNLNLAYAQMNVHKHSETYILIEHSIISFSTTAKTLYSIFIEEVRFDMHVQNTRRKTYIDIRWMNSTCHLSYWLNKNCSTHLRYQNYNIAIFSMVAKKYMLNKL